MTSEEGTSNVGGSSSPTEIHHATSKIDMVKFDGTNNIGLWRCKVRDALMAQKLYEAVLTTTSPITLKRGFGFEKITWHVVLSGLVWHKT